MEKVSTKNPFPKDLGTESGARVGPFPYVTAGLSGAAVMVVEVGGTRVLGPVFGVGLFVWAALLTVTLASLAGGYYAGGVWVDRRPSISLLGTVLCVAAIALGFAVVASSSFLALCLHLGPRLAPFASATVLFGPVLLLLGMVGPIVVRLVTSNVARAGHNVGLVYAISTVGSLLGTLLVSFVLIPAFEIDAILCGVALLLALNGAACLSGQRRAAIAALVVVAGMATTSVDFGSRDLPDEFDLVHREHSPYSLLEVLDDQVRQVRFLRADHSVIGGRFLYGGNRGVFGYLHIMEALKFAHPSSSTMLQIGLGTGASVMAMQKRGLHVDVVELDPGVVRLAQKYFGFDASGEVFVEDARAFLNYTERRYDLIVHDTFTGGATPAHLLSLEVLQRIKDRLRPGGILALNFLGFDEGEGAEATWAVMRTLRAAFPVVRAFRDAAESSGDFPIQNLVFFASDHQLDLSPPADATYEDAACSRVLSNFQQWELVVGDLKGDPITDAKNPLDRLQLRIADQHFSAMSKLLPEKVWLP